MQGMGGWVNSRAYHRSLKESLGASEAWMASSVTDITSERGGSTASFYFPPFSPMTRALLSSGALRG